MQLIATNKDKNIDYAYFIFLVSLSIMINYNKYEIQSL